MAASYVGCDRFAAIVLFTIAMGIMGTFYCGMKVNALDLSPNYAGTLMAIINGLGAISGMIVPYLIGALTPNVSGTSYQKNASSTLKATSSYAVTKNQLHYKSVVLNDLCSQYHL